MKDAATSTNYRNAATKQLNKDHCVLTSYYQAVILADLEFSILDIGLQLRTLSNPSEIAHNEDILRIFLMACEVKTVKISVIGLSCLQKLISHDAVAPSALKEILSTLKDVSLTDISLYHVVIDLR